MLDAYERLTVLTAYWRKARSYNGRRLDFVRLLNMFRKLCLRRRG
jgi:hypothetical protein